jgi:glycosyltransferase involved in cell wall biosynthesis
MLCACIDSILRLSLRSAEREIIIVDDGSDNSPMNSLLKYGDEIIYLRQKNGGVSVARNTAMAMAKGEYIQIIDGDDFLIQAPYEHCLDIIRYNKDADVVMFDFTHDDGQGANSFNPPRVKTGTELMRSENIQGTACCYLFRQSVRGQLSFTPGIHYGEDEEFTPQLLIRAERVYLTEAKAYYYRERETSAVHQTDTTSIRKLLDDHLTVIRRLQKLADTMPQRDRLALQRRVAQLAMDHIYNTIILTRSEQQLDETIETLRQSALYPLPDRDYSTKYVWFRRLTNSRLGRKILLRTLPKIKKER